MEPQDFEKLMEDWDARKNIYRRCLHIFYRQPNAREIAEDMTQIVMIKAWRNIDGFRQDANLLSWLYTIATNASIDYLRVYKRHEAKTCSLEDVVKTTDTGEVVRNDVIEMLSQNHTEEKYLESLEGSKLDRVILAISPLPYEMWLPLRLLLEGNTYRDIAEALDLPEGTVKSRINRGKDFVRRRVNRT
ncbi:MAG: sigma-70 family RNA polymerase sigma factor [Candidatus Doudnabacteria bacterium]|nr:sigma-70 family RNA polymerase sigma factor [Candidatus Doudnabacteria bacterium]